MRRSPLLHCFLIIFCILMIATIYRMSFGSTNYPTFTGFLASLSDAPKVEFPFLSEYTKFLNEPWAILDFLRVFFAGIVAVFDFLTLIVEGFVQILVYVVFFFKWIFFVPAAL